MRYQKIVRVGNSYLIAIPKHLVTEEMLRKGVVLDVLHYDKKSITIKLVVSDGRDDEHNQNHKTSRKDT